MPPLYEVAARIVSDLGRKDKDDGYPDTGAVVGATHPQIGRRVREQLPETLFLVPGYGAQGGDVSGIRPLLDERGEGVLVNSSRDILYAFEKKSGSTYRDAAREASLKAREELRGMRAYGSPTIEIARRTNA